MDGGSESASDALPNACPVAAGLAVWQPCAVVYWRVHPDYPEHFKKLESEISEIDVELAHGTFFRAENVNFDGYAADNFRLKLDAVSDFAKTQFGFIGNIIKEDNILPRCHITVVFDVGSL